jgi:glycosyltransferase 2 family protein
MPNVTRVISRAIRQRLDWNRIGIAIGLLIVAIAAITLAQLLRDIEIDKVVAALRSKSIREILIAGVFVAIGFVALSFYDFFALRTIGRDAVPYRVAAFASFTSYTIGHNLGATVFTAGVIRLRIYSAWGLSVVDIVKIAFVTGLTFWLGNAFVLGGGMAYAPEAASAVNQLPPWINRMIGISGLVVIFAYLLWLLPRPRVIGRADWQIALPSPRLTLVQIGIGVLDLGAGAIAMYALLPAQPAIDFITLLVIFVTAILLGFLSHAPGSLGVIEAAMLVGLPQFAKEELLASLLIFRFLYFVLPVSLAALMLGMRELWLLGRTASSLGDRDARQLWKMRSNDCTRAIWGSAWARQRNRVHERKPETHSD